MQSRSSSSGACVTQSDTRFTLCMQEDMKHLLRDAAEGLPVAQRKVTWETERPTVQAVGDAKKLRGFVEYGRQALPYRPVEQRVQDYAEVLGRLPQKDHEDLLHTQAARCMDCGTPFCHQTASGGGSDHSCSLLVLSRCPFILPVWLSCHHCALGLWCRLPIVARLSPVGFPSPRRDTSMPSSQLCPVCSNKLMTVCKPESSNACNV